MVDRPALGSGEDADDAGDRFPGDFEKPDITLTQREGPGCLPIVRQRIAVEERQMVEGDGFAFEGAPTFGRQFGARTEIDDIPQSEFAAQAADIRVTQGVQCVAPIELPPAESSTIRRRIAPEIPEIHTAIQIDSSLHGAGV